MKLLSLFLPILVSLGSNHLLLPCLIIIGSLLHVVVTAVSYMQQRIQAQLLAYGKVWLPLVLVFINGVDY